MIMEVDIKSFECAADGEVINPSVVRVNISKDPKTSLCGSYLNDGKVSCPTYQMLIRHVQSGYTFFTESVDKSIPFNHLVDLMLKSKEDVMPEIKSGDTFICGGFIWNEAETEYTPKFTTREHNGFTIHEVIYPPFDIDYPLTKAK